MADPTQESIVCRCYVVPEGRIRRAAVEHQLRAVEEVTALTRAGGGCSSCWDDIRRILDRVWGKPPSPDAPDASGLSSVQKRDLVARVVEQELQAVFDLNGLQMQLVEVSGDRVLVRFTGDRVGTQAASFLAIKRYLVRRMSDACGQKMSMVELNVLEERARLLKA